MTRRFVIALAALAVAAGACSSTVTEEMDFDQPSSIVVDVESGSVTVRSRQETGASVTIEKSGEDEAMAETALENGELRVSGDCAPGTDCRTDVLILVGSVTDVSVTVGDGSVAINGIEGSVTVTGGKTDVSLNSIMGEITVAVDEGNVLGALLESSTASFSTGAGRIDVTFEAVIDDLTIASGDGDVTAQVPGGPYRVEAQGDGEIDVQVDVDDAAPRTIRISTEAGDVTVYRN